MTPDDDEHDRLLWFMVLLIFDHRVVLSNTRVLEILTNRYTVRVSHELNNVLGVRKKNDNVY